MRIISGFLKGKPIDFLKSSSTRPLRDFVKESVFNVVKHSNIINMTLEDNNILDLYSGVGSFGIECISNGAKKAFFVENNVTALSVLKKNLKDLKIQDKCTIFETNIMSFFKRINKKIKFEIIFLDPPFTENFFIQDLKTLKDSKIYTKNHIVIIHREKKSKDDLKDIIDVVLTKTYGRSRIIFGNFNSNIS
tara:strand:+ start:60 stop:635 length:576 start_codon:yes stop_codon:yes gene_type:complete